MTSQPHIVSEPMNPLEQYREIQRLRAEVEGKHRLNMEYANEVLALRAEVEQYKRDAERYRAMMTRDLTAEYSGLWFARLNYSGDDLADAEDEWDAALGGGEGKG